MTNMKSNMKSTMKSEGIAVVLSEARLFATGASIARNQQADGMIPWARGMHADPWNHVEAAMALVSGGFVDEARSAYRWLAANQHDDGSWCAYYLPSAPGGIEDPKRDTNVCAYVATGVMHWLLATGDHDFAREMWPVVERAADFVVSWQQPGGELAWAVEPTGKAATAGPSGRLALLTGSSSAYHSLRCAVALAEALDMERPEWELAAGRLATAIAFRNDPGDDRSPFEPKSAWAMDWYYPVLCGAVSGDAGRARLEAGWARFVTEGHGVRCIADNPWFTGAETAECAMAHAVVGRFEEARALLAWAHKLRHVDGSYFTGIVQPVGKHFPASERTSYTAAAVVLAHHCLFDESPAAGLLRGDGLPTGFDLDLAAIAQAELDLD
jgi:hypothetical protein